MASELLNFILNNKYGFQIPSSSYLPYPPNQTGPTSRILVFPLVALVPPALQVVGENSSRIAAGVLNPSKMKAQLRMIIPLSTSRLYLNL